VPSTAAAEEPRSAGLGGGRLGLRFDDQADCFAHGSWISPAGIKHKRQESSWKASTSHVLPCPMSTTTQIHRRATDAPGFSALDDLPSVMVELRAGHENVVVPPSS